MADRRRVVQVLNNLFINASDHSPDRSPIKVTGETSGVAVAISVIDKGAGVPTELLPHLFRKYTGLGIGDPQRKEAATGLGLAICKGLVEAHGGRIWAESAGDGQGTRFTFTLPVAEEGSGATDVGLRRVGSPKQSAKRSRVLVVDDDPETLRYVRNALEAAAYNPVLTSDSQDLPGLIKKHRPHLVLLDLLLPGTDGIELMERVPELEDLPVIFISAYGRDETIASALEAGAADYIVKPFSPTELVARIRTALRKNAEPEPFVLGDLAIHYDERRVSEGGRPVHLTPTEYELLHILSVNAGRVVSYETLLRRLWGGEDATDPKLVRSFVKKLRQKLRDSPASPAYIFTVRGFGYRMPRSAD